MRYVIIDLNDTLAYTNRDIGTDPEHIPQLKLVEGAMKFLQRHKWHSTLLTAGDRQEEEEKIEVLGIRRCFRQIVILPKPENKRLWLEEFVRNFPHDPSHIVIVGDRLDVEIAKGNELGCTTVRVRLPSGAHYLQMPTGGPQQVIHYTVRDFTELLSIFPN